LLFARCVGCRVVVFMHEWAGLHRLRRIAFAPFVWFSSAILVVSPLIAGEIAQTRWLPGVGEKCRLVPNAPTVWPGEPLATERVEHVRTAASNCDIVIGHFGALYKGKASTALLDVCHYLRGRGVRALIVFIGSFPPSLDGYEQQFWAKVAEYGIEDQVIVTGYVTDDAELYTLFNEVGVFLYLFAEGLTARRSSVIHCLQSNRPVVVTEPRSMNEFAHHKGFQSVIASGALSFIPADASPQTIADRLFDLAKRGGRTTQATAGQSLGAFCRHCALHHFQCADQPLPAFGDIEDPAHCEVGDHSSGNKNDQSGPTRNREYLVKRLDNDDHCHGCDQNTGDGSPRQRNMKSPPCQYGSGCKAKNLGRKACPGRADRSHPRNKNVEKNAIENHRRAGVDQIEQIAVRQ
jgi:hypothetical protein